MLSFGAEIAKISNRRKYPLYGIHVSRSKVKPILICWGRGGGGAFVFYKQLLFQYVMLD